MDTFQCSGVSREQSCDSPRRGLDRVLHISDKIVVASGSTPAQDPNKMIGSMRKGCIYSEWQNNLGRGGVRAGRLRWVAEIHIRGKRYRFRSTNYANAAGWLEKMSETTV